MVTEGEKLKVRRLLNQALTYEEIAVLMRWTPRQVRTFAERNGFRARPEKAKAPLAVKKKDVAVAPGTNAWRRPSGLTLDCEMPRPGPKTLAERERAFSGRRSLTASIMGDPMPGRSALDKRRMADA